MFIAALGCNLAWGLVDGVMYLVRTVVDRGRSLTLVRTVRGAADPQTGRALIEGSFSRVVAGLVAPTEIEAIRGRIVALPARSCAAKLNGERSARRAGDLPAGRARHLSRRSALRTDARRRRGEERIPRGRARDAVPRWACPGPLRGLRLLAGRLHDDWGGRGAGGRNHGARRMNAASRRVRLARRRRGHGRARRRRRRQRPPRRSGDETLVGVRAHRVSDRRSPRRQLHLGDRGRRSRPAASRGPGQLRVGGRAVGLRRLDLFRRGRDHLGADAPARRRLGLDPGLRARPRGEPVAGALRFLRRGRIRAPRRRRRPQLLLCLERAGLSAGRVASRRPGGPAHPRLRRRARHPARPVRAGDLAPRHPRRLLVQPGRVGPGVSCCRSARRSRGAMPRRRPR